ncbi:MAG TPA: hypothetical protein VFT87_03320 [Candidatus Saccharimonadales bacterium]|nr:hypothetical protein [Candidatus Saccharimonadales bacterium]
MATAVHGLSTCPRLKLMAERRRQTRRNLKWQEEERQSEIKLNQELVPLIYYVRCGLRLVSAHRYLLWRDRDKKGLPWWMWSNRWMMRRMSYMRLVEFTPLCTLDNLLYLLGKQEINSQQLIALLNQPLPEPLQDVVWRAVNAHRNDPEMELRDILQHPEWWEGFKTADTLKAGLHNGLFASLWRKSLVDRRTIKLLLKAQHLGITEAFLASLNPSKEPEEKNNALPARVNSLVDTTELNLFLLAAAFENKQTAS